MPIPESKSLFIPVLTFLYEGSASTLKEIREYCINVFQISEAEVNLRLANKRRAFAHRVECAVRTLRKKNLIERPDWDKYVITHLGQEYLRANSEENPAALFLNIQEIEDAISELKSKLVDELLAKVKNMNPYRFERLGVDLLLKMGYGSYEDNKDAVTRRSGDGGIDAIVKTDKFGFDAIYIQTKKWRDSVGDREVKQFASSISVKGASKGLFITTGQFAQTAKDFAAKQMNPKIILIDGRQLAELMIEYNLGIKTVKTYSIKQIDSVYFDVEK